MPRRVTRLWANCDGVSALEFALVAPVLLMLLLGAVDFGRMFYYRQGLEYATQAGARYYVLNANAAATDVTTYVKGKMPGGSGPSISVSYVNTTNCNGTPQVTCTTITATYDFAFAGYIPIRPLTLRASAQAVRLL